VCVCVCVCVRARACVLLAAVLAFIASETWSCNCERVTCMHGMCVHIMCAHVNMQDDACKHARALRGAHADELSHTLNADHTICAVNLKERAGVFTLTCNSCIHHFTVTCNSCTHPFTMTCVSYTHTLLP